MFRLPRERTQIWFIQSWRIAAGNKDFVLLSRICTARCKQAQTATVHRPAAIGIASMRPVSSDLCSRAGSARTCRHLHAGAFSTSLTYRLFRRSGSVSGEVWRKERLAASLMRQPYRSAARPFRRRRAPRQFIEVMFIPLSKNKKRDDFAELFQRLYET